MGEPLDLNTPSLGKTMMLGKFLGLGEFQVGWTWQTLLVCTLETKLSCNDFMTRLCCSMFMNKKFM